MNLSVSSTFLIVLAITVLVATLIVWKALDDVSDFIVFLGKLTDVFSGAMPNLKQSQRFNVLVDIVATIGIGFFAFLLKESYKDVFHALLILAVIVVVCLIIAFMRR